MNTHCPCDLHRGGAKDHGVVHADQHVAQLLLHAAMVHSLCCGTDVLEGGRGGGALKSGTGTLITYNTLPDILISVPCVRTGSDMGLGLPSP